MSAKPPVYLDCHATTPVDPRVLDAMLPYFKEHFGNAASSSHAYGWKAGDAVDRAREQVAKALGADPREILFTSGATESNNLAIKGVAQSPKGVGKHLVTASTEHKAVLDPIRRLEREGWPVTVIQPMSDGLIPVESVASALRPDTALVSIMAANNEIGTIQDIQALAAECRSRGALFHTDATQAVGRIPLDVRADGVDLLSLTAHKIYGPKGIGALFVRRGAPLIRLAPLFDGGGHERGMRSGTLPVPLIVGFGEAITIALAEREAENERIRLLRDRLLAGFQASAGPILVNGTLDQRLPGNLNVSVPGVDGEALMLNLREVAVSSGSACSSANPEPSHVLRAIGVSDDLSRSSLRFGLGRFTTGGDVDFAIRYVTEVIHRLRSRIS